MKILTLNTWGERGPWKERWEIIFQGLEKFRPEIVAFQEVFNAEWAKEVQSRVGFKHLVFPAEPGGLTLLSQFPVEEWECITFATQSPSEEYRRYALYAKLSANSKSISFFNTHLSWRLNESEIREYQVGELMKFIKLKAGKNATFVTGDFNAPPDTREIRRMMLEGGLIDLYGTKNPGAKGLTWDNQNPYAAGSSVALPDRRIDYIFIQGISIVKVGNVDVVLSEPQNGIYASDHFGVLAEINE